MARIYNYRTKRLYESTGTYSVSVIEEPLSPEVEISPEESEYEFVSKYYSEDEATDAIGLFINSIIEEEGVGEGDYDMYEENGDVVLEIDGLKKWTFHINTLLESAKPKKGKKTINESKKDDANESVSTRFSKLRSMFEAAGLDEDEVEEEEDEDEKDADAAPETADNADDKDNADDNADDKSDDKSDDDSEDSDDDSEEMKAVIVTVAKDDADKCKEEMVDAGIADEDIEILDADDDAENVEIRIDVNSVMELKDYLKGKGIDLEEEIGGEIVDDSEEDGEEDADSEGGEGDEGDDGDDDFNFDDLDDLFGAGDEDEK